MKRTLLLPLLAIGMGLSQQEPGDPAAGPEPPPLDSARAEVAVGRYWHATRILRRYAESETLRPPELLLLAQAEAGRGGWGAALSILEGAEWLDELEGGGGRLLLARALEEADRWEEAAASYAAYRTLVDVGDGIAPGLRRALVMARAGLPDVAEELRALARTEPLAASWAALEMSRLASEEGDPARVVALRSALTDPDARSRAWNLEARAQLASGDTAAAVASYESLVDGSSVGRQARALQTVAELKLATGDSAGALEAAARSFEVRSRGPSSVRAARMLLDMGDPSPEDARTLAVALEAGGDAREALRALQIHLGGFTADSPPSAERLLDRARLLSATGNHEEAVRQFRSLAGSAEGDFELELLKQWRDVRRTQGRRDAVRTIDGWIVERFPESGEAVDVIFFRADQLHDRGDLVPAAQQYRLAADMAPSLDRAGLSRMRLGQVHLARGDLEAAAEAFEEYLEAFPDGSRWDQAAFWAGRATRSLEDEERSRAHLDLLRRRFPLSYYTVLAAELDGIPFSIDLPEGPAPVVPAWMDADLEALDLLREAGMSEAAEVVVGRIVERSEESLDAMFALAEELLARGLTVEGIRLGWGIRARGRSLDRRLLRVIYPFPYREIVEREAAERGVDPLFMAALIRQESAFTAAIHSRAGAIGLMQVMPATGRQLARAEGIRGFTPANLESPEINVHLGAMFWVDMARRFGEDNLPLVLTAYNAGPTRANLWRNFPEVVDPARFTERIPFTETRGYVKSVRRFLALYEVLYGGELER